MSLECRSQFAQNKSNVNKLVDLFHMWPWPLTLPLTLGMNFQGQILKLSYLQNIWTDRKNKDGWILWMVWYIVNNVWPTLFFNRMLQCRSCVTFQSLATSVWLYLYRNGDCVYLGHNTCWVLVLGFTPYTHRSCMNFAKFCVTRTQIWWKLWSNLLRLFDNIWNADGLMEGWTDGNYAIWPRAKWNIVDEYSIVQAFNNEWHWK